ncbi:MAG: BREX-2 system adenine-specific DNA-methyltransferase PglX [Polaromonas sp.]|uniref:BREX-2 system adenine-specific DNA-methyltransferase PglX n=1 Tax=Polaromonas sp. TaxID=1869339 RepID=UPI002487176F|nr:BREX-2 system adenine-specific DNA-methyltransferase PglX [Polaromonas sp.]MDI1269465.1 BREX-2 system adenine-specific DNA-methyltransferase PglX [Polaromonas sp.]
MIDAPQLLADLKRRLAALEVDLRERINALPDLKASLQAEWQTARDAKRTAETFESWSDQVITQAGVHWLLSCVFLRFIEDNSLVDRPWIGGTPDSGRLALARDRHEAYFRANPLESDREYLLACFTEAGSLPGLHTFFDAAHNPVFRLGISGDAAMGLRQFWQQQDPNTGALLHDFTDPTWNTRFLGDLYQDLSEATRKRYALLQTPEFVEEFILDRTLTPAIREFGYQVVRMIDPTCGSGHFLLGGFHRMVDEWSRNEPNRNRRDVAQKALDAVAGVDLNPFAVAISRFRLLLAALQASDVHRLSEAPDFKIHVAIGDSLLHGQRFGLSGQSGIQSDELFDAGQSHADTGLAHAYASEDLAQVQQILGRQYHAVVGNPPYIVVKDAALNAAYRAQYASCHRQYSLGAPFTERFFELAITGRSDQAAGFVGEITANSFMKREFGSKLIEQVLPRLDLTHVIDTSGAYIPGHGTPTVILFGRHRPPVSEDEPIRTVMGIKGEPSAPADPAHGLVWSAILAQVARVGSQSEFISVTDIPRTTFARHPWSIGGGGATDIADAISAASSQRLGQLSEVFSGTGRTSADDVLVAPSVAFKRKQVEKSDLFPLVEGDQVRDWEIAASDAILTPYSSNGIRHIDEMPAAHRWLWPTRTILGNRAAFGNVTYFEEGRPWWSWHQISVSRLQYPYAITFAEIATHNHFVLDRGGKAFKQTAPVIKLPAGASEDAHLGLLGLLNSSVACFWLKQFGHCKGSGGIGGGIAAELWEKFYVHNSTVVAEFPLIDQRPIDLATRIDTQSQYLTATLPAALFAINSVATHARSTGATSQFDAETALTTLPLPTRASLDAARAQAASLRRQMIATQEELDWHCYELYSLLRTSDGGYSPFLCLNPPEVALGERAFEIVLARRLAAGTETTTWFERHGSTPITDIPSHWPEDYRQVVQRRIDLIESDRNIGLIERPEYKRRWNTPQWKVQEQAALRDWLLARLESPAYWPTSADQSPQLTSTSRLADAALRDADFMHMAALYAGHADFDVSQLVATLVTAEAAPFLPVLRYTEAGLRKREQWEATWALQRREDAGEDVGSIPVPPKYKSADYLKAPVWQLRGGLDVPKERWISYPGCERGADGSLPIAWAGWDHLQQATAIASYYLDMKDNEGWAPERLQPLLAGLLELVPWLEQWHNEVDPVYGERMDHYYKGFVTEEARAQVFTQDDLRAWKPAATTATRGRRKVPA